MKRIINIFVLLICILMTTSVFGAEVYAEENNNHGKQNVDISTRADNIEWVIRCKDGKLQKRKWNATKNVWVGDWIDIN